ncbi:MAG: cob(I)yrinic acid a,c-diamide adenosyltransferase [Candidatus Thermoplasmatota archaeon]|jgi:ATP:cob(I)alamin adenosyltransferase|nr:cob(I)yrinic acid a,c-diamide adenosyltransferase [Candidatus Thermoplasmatota archaeon]
MFTRKGDTGETDTGERKRVSKSSMIIGFQGDLDSLISFIGDALVSSRWDDVKEDLARVQNDLYTLGEEIITSGKKRTLDPGAVSWLEERTIAIKKEVGRIKLFVVPGGSRESTSLHIARTVCRDAERSLVSVSETTTIRPELLQYMNRLSSLLFFHSLVSNKRLGIEERIWDIGRES